MNVIPSTAGVKAGTDILAVFVKIIDLTESKAGYIRLRDGWKSDGWGWWRQSVSSSVTQPTPSILLLIAPLIISHAGCRPIADIKLNTKLPFTDLLSSIKIILLRD